MKPHLHANASVKKWGGQPSDYQAIHDFFDQTKAHFPDMRHRAILHNSFGIYLCEKFFGYTITNSDGKVISVRDIGENHILEDLGKIPTLQDYLVCMELKDWMGGVTRKRQLDRDLIPLPELPIEKAVREYQRPEWPGQPYLGTDSVID